MNGVHDVGGMQGFGPVTREPNEPVFHAEWERRIFALALATMGARRANVDEFRRTIERIPPATYLTSSYYERWLYALEALLIEKRIISDGEVDAKINVEGVGVAPVAGTSTPGAADKLAALDTASAPDGDTARPSGAVALRHDPKFKARFKLGDRVLARTMNPEGHTRAPRYIRGHRGIIRHDWGTFVFPDTHAHSAGTNPQHCYNVEFQARELWGESYPARERIRVDLWEAYLRPDTAAMRAEEIPAARAAASPRPAPAAKAAQPRVPAAKAAQPRVPAVKRAATVAKAKAKPAAVRVRPKRKPETRTPTVKKASKRTTARRVRKGRQQ